MTQLHDRADWYTLARHLRHEHAQDLNWGAFSRNDLKDVHDRIEIGVGPPGEPDGPDGRTGFPGEVGRNARGHDTEGGR